MSTPTPHNEARHGDIAKTVLMPGDPLRAQVVAEKYLTNVTCFNHVRGMLGFTGEYNGRPVSVMGSGMGMPSIGIYSYELFKFYDAENIIRIGTAGGLAPGMKLGDIAIGISACTNSNYSAMLEFPGTFAPTADFELARKAVEACERFGFDYRVGSLFSSDTFYGGPSDAMTKLRDAGILAVEMEAAALFTNATATGKRALAIVTISDLPLTGETTTSEERQNAFTNMMRAALELA